jgi:GR25 family glycosyltransferase involved in LPS biosynthesis
MINKDKVIFVCASLAGETVRQRSFSENFSDKSLFCFVDSVDGRGWSDFEADVHVSDEMRQLRERERLKGKLWINPAAIACALTHRDKLLVEAEKRDVVLCEDDVLLKCNFIEIWREDEVRRKFAKCDGLVLMHYTSRSPITASGPPIAEFSEYQIFKLDEVHVSSGACYYAPPSVARRIRQYQTPVSVSADHWLAMKKAGAFSDIYVVHPSPCTIAGMASNIGYGGNLKSNAWWIVLARRLKRMVQLRRKRFYETLVVQR